MYKLRPDQDALEGLEVQLKLLAKDPHGFGGMWNLLGFEESGTALQETVIGTLLEQQQTGLDQLLCQTLASPRDNRWRERGLDTLIGNCCHRVSML